MSLNDLIISDIKLSLFETTIIKSLNIFYNNSKNIELLKTILLIKTKLSIRLIDYFTTKYSKINKITYNINNSSFNVFISYKQQLKMYQKKYFDPFSRGCRIPFFLYDSTDKCENYLTDKCENYSTNECENSYTSLITTIGQLNFFKWFIEKNIYDYILDNYENIESSMNIHNKEIKDTKKEIKNIKKKNNNISKNIIVQNNIKYNSNLMPIVVSFSF